MARSKKDAKILNIRMDLDVYEELEKFCEETGLTKTTATEKILHKFFEEYFAKSEEERKIFE